MSTPKIGLHGPQSHAHQVPHRGTWFFQMVNRELRRRTIFPALPIKKQSWTSIHQSINVIRPKGEAIYLGDESNMRK